MTDIKPCPACGREYARLLRDSSAWQCCNLNCVFTGPCDDRDGTKWNSLPRRTPGTIEVPVSEIEGLNKAYSNGYRHADSVAAERYDSAVLAITARLPPPAPDHVAILRNTIAVARGGAKREFSLAQQVAAIEAAIAALEAKR